MVRSECRILTTEIVERLVYAIGLFRDTGNYKIFPLKRDGHNTVFTNSFQSLKETINIAGWVILLEKSFCVEYISNWSFTVETVTKSRKCHQSRVCYIKVEMIHQSRKQHHGRKCNIEEGSVIKIENAIHQSRKCDIKIENAIKVENAISMFITQCKEK